MKRIGVLGNGQLGRMLILRAHEMGASVTPYGPDSDSPAEQVSRQSFVAPYEDEEQLKAFAESVDIATVEFENIPVSALEFLSERIEVHPAPRIIWVCQNRSREKNWLKTNNFPVVPNEEIKSRDSLFEYAKKIGFPFVIKTTGFGYDGKGQTKITSSADLLSFEWKNESYVVEKWLENPREGSIIVCQNETGTCLLGPFENQHSRHILDVTHFPSSFSPAVKKQMEEISRSIAQQFKLKGILCVEFFVDKSETVFVNEMAPRPHNSGHLTIEAFRQSQFEQQLRAIQGLPLGDGKSVVPAAAMANLLGDHWKSKSASLTPLLDTNVTLHWYGKKDLRPGRKMGHLTAIDSTSEAAIHRVRQVRNLL